jgi:hypothetical protein
MVFGVGGDGEDVPASGGEVQRPRAQVGTLAGFVMVYLWFDEPQMLGPGDYRYEYSGATRVVRGEFW